MPSEPSACIYSAVLMGSPITLKLFDHDEVLAAQVFRLIKQQENLLTVNRAPSEVMDINVAAGRHAVQVSPPVFELIQRAQVVSLLPGSLFNLAIGPVVKCWRIGFSGNSVPPAAELKARLALTNPRDVILDEATHSVFLARAGMEIDLGAIAKGHIADLVQVYLRKQGVGRALINLGGNLQTLGAAQQDGWTIGLKKPFDQGNALIGTVNVVNKSVVTSGIYERHFELDGKLYHHIIDPETGYPHDNELLAVTVISERSIDGDIFTTLLYGMGVENGIAFLHDYPGIEAIFITRDKRIICSSCRQFTFTPSDGSYTCEQ